MTDTIEIPTKLMHEVDELVRTGAYATTEDVLSDTAELLKSLRESETEALRDLLEKRLNGPFVTEREVRERLYASKPHLER